MKLVHVNPAQPETMKSIIESEQFKAEIKKYTSQLIKSISKSILKKDRKKLLTRKQIRKAMKEISLYHDKNIQFKASPAKKFAVPLIITAVVAGIASAIAALSDFMLKRHFSRPLADTDEKSIVIDDFSHIIPNNSEMSIWLRNKKYDEYEIMSKDNLKLKGKAIFQPSYSDKWVILVHGFKSKGDDMHKAAAGFFERGFNILIPDLRAHGNSEGDYISMGWHDKIDLKLWINDLVARFSEAQIVLYGLSMGAAVVMMTSSENIPQNVKCIIEDCGFSSVDEQLAYEIKRRFHLPAFPFIPIGSLVCKIKNGYSFYEVSSVKKVKNSKVPILFIHGDDDEIVKCDMVYKLYKAAKCRKTILVVKGARHGRSIDVDPKKYWDKVDEILDMSQFPV